MLKITNAKNKNLIIWSWFTVKKWPSNFWRKKYVAKWYTINKLTWKTQTHTLCDKLCQWLATGWWFSPGIPVSSINKTDRHDQTEILLKVALNTITLSFKIKWSIPDKENVYKCKHSQTCIKQSPFGRRKSGLIKQVTSW